MPVRIITDSSSNLPHTLAEQYEITVLPLHTMTQGNGKSTAGLSTLELVAAYARQLERGNDEGVVALHISKELSSTWSNAVTAAGVFTEPVSIADTSAVGMSLGLAAVSAAKTAAAGGDVDACRAAATDALGRCYLFLYLHRLDEMRRSGRMSAGITLMSTALATRPILQLKEGKFELAAKTRTQMRAFEKLTEFGVSLSGGKPVTVWLQQHEAMEASQQLAKQLEEALPDGSEVTIVAMDAALAVHSGPGCVAVTMQVAPGVRPPADALQPSKPKGMDFLALLKNDSNKDEATPTSPASNSGKPAATPEDPQPSSD